MPSMHSTMACCRYLGSAVFRRQLASAAGAHRKVPLGAIKELRSRSGAPMATVKEALAAEDGDIELAAERLRREGSRLASLRTGRVAQEGLVGLLRQHSGREAVLVELKCETDFVARTALFQETLARLAVSARAVGGAEGGVVADELLGCEGNDGAVGNASAVLGEKISLGRVKVLRGTGFVGGYVHGVVPLHEDAVAKFDVAGDVGGSGDSLQVGRIGVAVALEGLDLDAMATDEVTNRLAMHIAAEAPRYLRRDTVPAEVIEKEMDILMDAARAENAKPGAKQKAQDILRKVVQGRLNKWLADVVLEDQIMLGGDDIGGSGKPVSVAKWLTGMRAGVRIQSFERFAIS